MEQRRFSVSPERYNANYRYTDTTPAFAATIFPVPSSHRFDLLLAPGWPSASALLGRIADSRSVEQVFATVAAEPFDYSPPSDDRPYFFNQLRPQRANAQAYDMESRRRLRELSVRLTGSR